MTVGIRSKTLALELGLGQGGRVLIFAITRCRFLLMVCSVAGIRLQGGGVPGVSSAALRLL